MNNDALQYNNWYGNLICVTSDEENDIDRMSNKPLQVEGFVIEVMDEKTLRYNQRMMCTRIGYFKLLSDRVLHSQHRECLNKLRVT